MYGVPADLPLARFVGRELNQICIGRFQVQLHFDGAGSIYIQANWELRDVTGALIDADEPHADRDVYRIHRVLDVPVSAFTIDAPRSFTLVFTSGHTLTIHDDSASYESFSIQFASEDREIVV